MTHLSDHHFEMFELFEMTPDLVCIAGKDGYFKKINPAVISKLGYSKKELFAKPISTFIYPEDRILTSHNRKLLLNGQPLLNFQNRYVAKNGDIFWLEWTSIYVEDKEVVFAIAKDITVRKNNEKEIEEKYKKFKGLALHFKASMEKNRKYLSVELHEELAQMACVVKMDIDWIKANEIPLSVHAKSRIDHALAICDLLVNTIRRISFSISPSMLDDIGLSASLHWHCREFSVLNGIPCVFKGSYNEEDLTQEIRLDFFRICQESLTNVMYHAQAKKVSISIQEAGENIQLLIIDDGIGFDMEMHKKNTGLTHIRELVASINGELNIDSKPGKGTKLSVTISKQGKNRTSAKSKNTALKGHAKVLSN